MKTSVTNLTNGLLTRITQTPGQCGGRPCIRGMRIRVTDILEMLAENVSVPSLKTHKLSGKLKEFWSFSVDYDESIVLLY